MSAKQPAIALSTPLQMNIMKYTLSAIATIAFSVSSLLPVLAEGGYTPPNNGNPGDGQQNGTGTRVNVSADCSDHRGRGRRECQNQINFQALSANPSPDCSDHRGRGRRECES